MKQKSVTGVYKKNNQLFTENPSRCKGIKVYGEKVIKNKNKELRSWNPYRSKLAAAILNGMAFDITPDYNILYLGAATGTTISHLSDMVDGGLIYAVEISPISMKKLLRVCEKRKNIIPILSDANHPSRYCSIVSSVDLVYQDISQRNQADIFIENVKSFLKKDGIAILVVKARSIDVSVDPDEVYDKVCSHIKNNGLKIIDIINLQPFDRDHKIIFIKN